MTAKNTTDFGFEQIPTNEKTPKVKKIFDKVAPKYDLMNDIMSGGLHHIWKQKTIQIAKIRPDDTILDLAAGTGDLTKLWLEQIGPKGSVIMSDINFNMLEVGIEKLIDAGFWQQAKIIQANAEKLPFTDESFDCVSIAFGLRNMTHHNLVLEQAFRVLKPGGKLMVLEFSHPTNPMVKKLYDIYSFSVLPKLGEIIANDAESYRYLAESIRKHPKQQELKNRFLAAGFDSCKIYNFMSGIVALHVGIKY